MLDLLTSLFGITFLPIAIFIELTSTGNASLIFAIFGAALIINSSSDDRGNTKKGKQRTNTR